jgi:hypothetical protein
MHGTGSQGLMRLPIKPSLSTSPGRHPSANISQPKPTPAAAFRVESEAPGYRFTMKIAHLKFSLLAGSVFFLLIGVVHAIGAKVPGLYLYFDLRSYAYQDKIVAALILGWAIFFFAAFKSPTRILLKAILLSGLIAIATLTFINSRETVSQLAKIETVALSLYWLWLAGCYIRLTRNHEL